MTTKYILIQNTVNSLVEMLMKKYQASYDWAISAVLGSETYRNLLKSSVFLEQGDLFVFESLVNELCSHGIVAS